MEAFVDLTGALNYFLTACVLFRDDQNQKIIYYWGRTGAGERFTGDQAVDGPAPSHHMSIRWVRSGDF